MYVGIAIPWESFNQPDTTGITYPRLFGLGLLVLLFRRVPALLLTYKMMPNVVKDWKEAIFMGYFGPIGVGAVYYLQHTRLLFPKEDAASAGERALLDAICPGQYYQFRTSFVLLLANYSISGLLPRIILDSGSWVVDPHLKRNI